METLETAARTKDKRIDFPQMRVLRKWALGISALKMRACSMAGSQRVSLRPKTETLTIEAQAAVGLRRVSLKIAALGIAVLRIRAQGIRTLRIRTLRIRTLRIRTLRIRALRIQ